MVTPVYTKKEAAALLKISEKTVDRLVSSGRLNSIKMGRLRMFTDRNLNQLIAECEKV
jgi:excisionase family DNA binding protein